MMKHKYYIAVYDVPIEGTTIRMAHGPYQWLLRAVVWLLLNRPPKDVRHACSVSLPQEALNE